MKGKSKLILIMLAAVAIGLCCLSYFGIGSKSLLGVRNIKQGLDLQGGVAITYQAGIDDPTVEEMRSAISLIQRRLDRKNWTEAEVGQQGNNRIRVDIPGVENAEDAVSEIGRTAMLYFAVEGVDEESGETILEPFMDGSHVVNAAKQQYTGQSGSAAQIVVALEFDDYGKQAFETMTEQNVGKPIYILLDEEIISAPTVQEKISGGNCVIQGNFDVNTAEELASLIREGALPFQLIVINMNNVGARLGSHALQTSVIAGFIGILLVLAFMAYFYKVLGLSADLALVIYIGLVLIILSLFGVTLTLPGIAGIILSIGMAVDANVIIFERLKEELASGRSLRAALDAGYKRAFPAIMDGNVTTLIAAVVLFWLGTGPIKGFAQTLALGIVLSMFTAIVVTRTIVTHMIGVGVSDPKLYGAK